MIDSNLSQSCDTCANINVDGNANVNDNDSQLRSSIEKYKTAVKQVVIDVCKKEGVEPPDIVFNRCPDGQDTSCAIDSRTGKYMIYYNPKDLLRTIFHEVDHHRDIKTGKVVNDSSSINDKADVYAHDMTSKYFPLDEAFMDKNGNIIVAHENVTIVRDSVPIPAAPAASADPNQLVHDIYGKNVNQFGTNIDEPKILDDFPRLKQTLMEMKKDELKDEIKEFEHRGGILAHLDRVYEFPAGLTGLSADELNHIHTPTILAYISHTLASTFLSPLSKSIVVSLFGIFLMLMGVGFHKRLSTRDIMLLQSVGGQLTWGGVIPNLNPKQTRKIKHDFERLAEQFKMHKFKFSDMFETPEQEAEEFRPEIFKPEFEGFSATTGKPIRMDRSRIESSIDDIQNPDYYGSSMHRGSVIKLPKFSSRSHARFL